MSHYKRLLNYGDKGVAVVRGSIDLFCPMLRSDYPGQQGAAAALIGTTMAQLKPGRDWSQEDVDGIIWATEKVFREAIKESKRKFKYEQRARGTYSRGPEQDSGRQGGGVHVRLTDVPAEFHVAKTLCRVCLTRLREGYVASEKGGSARPTLRMALLQLCRNHLVLEHNNRFVSIWTDEVSDAGYLFDPLGADYPMHTDEVACVFRFDRFDAILPLLGNRMGMLPDDEYVLYEVKLLHSVEVKKVVEKVVARASSSTPLLVLPGGGGVATSTPFTPAVPPPKPTDVLNRPPPVGVVPASPSLYVDNFAPPRALAAVLPASVQERLIDTELVQKLGGNVPNPFWPLDEWQQAWMLMGHLSERDTSAPDFRDLAPPQCLVALATMEARFPMNWLRDNIDQVLLAGQRLYQKTRDQNPGFQGQSTRGYHQSRIEIEDQKLIVDVDTLTVMGRFSSTDPSVLDFYRGLMTFFSKPQRQRCVLEYGGLTTIAIRKYDDKNYFAFDPRPYNCNGALSDLDADPSFLGKAAIFHCFSLDALAVQVLRNIDPYQVNQPYTLRRVNFKPDQPGIVAWHGFQPLREGRSWYVSGRINSADEGSILEANHDKQYLGIAIMAIVAAHLVEPGEWSADTVDGAVLEGDDYYTWCKPRTGESGNDDWNLTLTNMRLIAFHQRRKCRLRLRERVCTGNLATTSSSVSGRIASGRLPTLAESLDNFFFELNETHGVFDCSPPGELPNHLAFWAHSQELDNGIVEWSYYLFHDHPDAYVRKAALGAKPEVVVLDEDGQPVPPPAFASQESACVLRFGYLNHLAEFLEELFLNREEEDDEYAGQAAGPAASQQQLAADRQLVFHLHSLKLDSIEDKVLSEDELAREKYQSVIPEMTEYVRDTATSGYLLGSENCTLPKFQYRQSGTQAAAVALSALAMRHMCDPFKWTKSTIDTIMALGDAVTRSNATEIRADEDNAGAAGEDQQQQQLDDDVVLPPRHYHLPDEFTETVRFGFNEFNVSAEKHVDGSRDQLCRLVEEFFNVWSMGVFRSLHVQMAIWRYDNVYFFFEPFGHEDNKHLAGCYYELDFEQVCEVLSPIALNNSFSVYSVQLELRAPLPLAARPGILDEDTKLNWYDWLYIGPNLWTIECKNPAGFNVNWSVSVCVAVLMFASIFEPQQWTGDLLRIANSIGQDLHHLNAERMAEDRMFAAHEMISEFYIGGRQIQPNIQDCVVHDRGWYSSGFEKSFEKHLAHFFLQHQAGIMCSRDRDEQPWYAAFWKKDGAYYVFLPHEMELRRLKDLRFSSLFIAEYSRWEIAAFSVTNCEFVRNVPDPSPALRPADLPELNAYQPIVTLDGRQLPARGILRASSSEVDYAENGSGIVRQQGYPTSSNCLVAIVAKLLHESSMWTKGILDEILAQGQQQHLLTLKGLEWQGLLSEGRSILLLHPMDVHSYIDFGQSKFHVQVLRLDEPLTRAHPGVFGRSAEFLVNYLFSIFRQFDSCILIINNRYMVSIWGTPWAYYLFDPKPRDEQGIVILGDETDGKPLAEGYACVTWYGSLIPLVDVIIVNSDEVWTKLEVYPVAALKLTPAKDIQSVDINLVKQDVKRLIDKDEPLIKRQYAPENYHWSYGLLYNNVQKTSIKPRGWQTMKLTNSLFVEYIQGSIHLETIRARTPLMAGQQSSAVALIALCLARLFAPLGWTSKMIDQAVQNGSFLHAEQIYLLRAKLKKKPPPPEPQRDDENFLYNRNIQQLPGYASPLRNRSAEVDYIPARHNREEPDELHLRNQRLREARVSSGEINPPGRDPNDFLHDQWLHQEHNLGYNLDVCDLPHELRLGNTTHEVRLRLPCTTSGTCAGGWLGLLECLKIHFGAENPGPGDQKPEYSLLHFGDFTLAIVRSADTYFFLDPTEKNKSLLPWEASQSTGAACLFQCKNLRALAVTISSLWNVWDEWDKIANVSRRDYRFDVYHLYTLEIEPRSIHDNDNNNR